MVAKMGRPTRFTKKIAEDICAEIREGKSLRLICDNPKMPYRSTVFRWLSKDSFKDFRDQYARACEDRANAMAEDIIDIADDGDNDTYVDDEGNVRTDHDIVQRSKLRIETRKWLMAKTMPKKYGEKLDLTNSDRTLEPVQIYSTKLTEEEIKAAKAKKAKS